MGPNIKKKPSTFQRNLLRIFTVIITFVIIDELRFYNSTLKDVEVVYFTESEYSSQHGYQTEPKGRQENDQNTKAEQDESKSKVEQDKSKPEIDTSISLIPSFLRNQDTSTNNKENTKIDILSKLDILSRGYESNALDCPFPLTPFHNIIKRSAHRSSTSASLIPKILHVSFINRCVGRDHAYFLSKWSDTLKDYSIFYYDDESVDNLINEEWPEFPDLHEAMKCIQYKGAMVVDVWRVLILYKYGGVYTDIDNTPTALFDQNTIPHNVSGFFFSDNWNRPSQWFMAFEPKHPIMHLSISYIIDNLLNMASIVGPQTVFVTGPGAVQQAYSTFIHWKDSQELDDNEIVTGLFSKKVKKISHSETKKFITVQDTQEMVPYNATLNVNRRDRIFMDTGSLHWDIVKYKTWKHRIIPDMSCREFLKSQTTKDNQDED